MDAVGSLLDGPRARDAFLLRASMDPPWGIDVQDEAPLTVLAVVRGEAWVVAGAGPPRSLEPGDVALVRGPDPYLIADDPATSPQIFVGPEQQCVSLSGEPLHESMSLGVRTWGNTEDGEDVMLIGTYGLGGHVGRRLLEALPALVVLDAENWNSPLIAVLAEEVVKDEPGQAAVLDRLLDLLLVALVRAWLTQVDADGPAWYSAYRDPIVGGALRLIEGNPTEPWTVAGLAGEVGISRAALARRFTRLVGEPPMRYLAEWRITLAADLLLEPGTTVESVAAEVGYGSAFALSTAFKRIRGITPREHRTIRPAQERAAA